MNHKYAPRLGSTIGRIVENHPEFELVRSSDARLTRGSKKYIALFHACLPGTKRPFEMRAGHFANGHLCTHCGPHSKSFCGESACEPCESRSLLAHKDAILERGVRMLVGDDVLRTTNANSPERAVPCACAVDAAHPRWMGAPHKLSVRGDGCNLCGYAKGGAAKARPSTFENSLAAVLDRLAMRVRGVAFVRLLNESDTRGPEDICAVSGKYAVWTCLCCENEWTQTIANVVKTSSCPSCFGFDDTERIVVEYLRTLSDGVVTQYPLGDYRVDAVISIGGKRVAVEVDGAQHYVHNRLFSSRSSLEERISIDVEKMRRSAAESVPTLRVPTMAISKDASREESWKGEVARSVEDAASWSDGEFPMFVLRGHETKYETHACLLASVL